MIEIRISLSLSLSLLFRSVTLLRASPLLFSLLSPRLPVLPPPDDSLLHEKSGRRDEGEGFFTIHPTAATEEAEAGGKPGGRTKVFVC